jgi:hypothetical protein
MEASGYVDKENVAERLERLHDKIEVLKVRRCAAALSGLLAQRLRNEIFCK